MNRQLAESIIRCLRLDSEVEESARDLARFSEREWRSTLHWLDWSGLALYLLARLQQSGMSHCLPRPIAARISQNLSDNNERNRGMLAETVRISREFQQHDVPHVVIKGPTLVPVFCPDAGLRHQSDLDFLIDSAAADHADQTLRGLGYTLAKSFADTRTYTRTPGFVPRHREMYRAGIHHDVEVHFVLWEFLRDIGAAPPADVLALATLRPLGSARIPALRAVDQFLHQAVHVIAHVVLYWVRTCWLYELARGIRHYNAEPDFWADLRDRCGEQPNCASVVCTAMGLAQQTFGVPLGAAEAFVHESLTPDIALWLEHYGRTCVMTPAPGTKLTMLLHREWMAPSIWREYEREKLFPFHRSAQPYLVSNHWRPSAADRLREWVYAARRAAFHFVEGARYVRARRQWKRLVNANRSTDVAAGARDRVRERARAV